MCFAYRIHVCPDEDCDIVLVFLRHDVVCGIGKLGWLAQHYAGLFQYLRKKKSKQHNTACPT